MTLALRAHQYIGVPERHDLATVHRRTGSITIRLDLYSHLPTIMHSQAHSVLASETHTAHPG